jgi:hypothetical protein
MGAIATMASIMIAPGTASAVPGPASDLPRLSAPGDSLETDRSPSTTKPSTTKPATITLADPGESSNSSHCGGRLEFGEVVVCPSIVGTEPHVYTVTTAADSDMLYTMLTRGSGDTASARVTDAAGNYVCYFGVDAKECRLGAAGTYTITVSVYFETDAGDYTLSVESMRTPSSCSRLPEGFFSFDEDGRNATLPYGAAAHCYSFEQPVGTVLHLADPGIVEDVLGSILSGQYEEMYCPVRYTTQCTLTKPGPYWLFLRESYGYETTYTLRMPRISDAFGCQTVPLAGFGDPGAAAGNATLAEEEQVACHSVTADAPGPVLVRINPPSQYVGWTIYDHAGRGVCDAYSASRYCNLPEAGRYALVTRNRNYGMVRYRVAVVNFARTDGCADTADTSWDRPALLVHQTSPVQTNCLPFQGEAGDRILTHGAPTVHNQVSYWIVDDRGVASCATDSEQDGCVLPATGTYRLLSFLVDWEDGSEDLTYRLEVRRLTNAVGCPVVTPGSYGAPPASPLGGIRCRSLDISTPGRYLVDAMDEHNYMAYVRVYDLAGQRVCAWSTMCNFASPGRYTLVLHSGEAHGETENDFPFALALLPSGPTGCEQVSDTGYAEAAHQGEFATLGQYNCLQLPSPAGSRIVALLRGDATGASYPGVSVVDSTGSHVCDSSSLTYYSCALNGTGPFFAMLKAREGYPTGSYALAFARMDGPPDCQTLPRGETATAITSSDRYAVCFSIPADQHAARETFTYRRTAGTGDARMSVFSSTGLRYCGPTGQSIDRTFSCSLPAGPVTVILEADGVDAAYQVTHRDASAPSP